MILLSTGQTRALAVLGDQKESTMTKKEDWYPFDPVAAGNIKYPLQLLKN